MINALSVDLEDWYQGIIEIDRSDWHKCEDRIVQNTERLLSIFDTYDAKATFFVLGAVAEKFPGLIKSIYESGHEIAAHGYCHEVIYRQTKEEFKADILKTKRILEQIIPTKIEGYRAPFFSVTKDTLWALEMLEELNFKYDSSIFPTKNPYYGIPDARRFIYKPTGGGLVEFPLSTLRIFGFNIPVAGGFYLRCFPARFICRAVSWLNKKGHPAVFYFHPWEIDPDRPRVKLSLKGKLIWDYNIEKMEGKLKTILKNFDFACIKDVLAKREEL